MAAIITNFVARISKFLGLTASAAVTATTALGAAPPTSKAAAALVQPRPEHHALAVPGAARTETIAAEVLAILPSPVAATPAVVTEPHSLALPEQRSMPGWLAARTAIDARRNKARARNARRAIPVRKACPPKRQPKRVVWRERT